MPTAAARGAVAWVAWSYRARSGGRRRARGGKRGHGSCWGSPAAARKTAGTSATLPRPSSGHGEAQPVLARLPAMPPIYDKLSCATRTVVPPRTSATPPGAAIHPFRAALRHRATRVQRAQPGTASAAPRPTAARPPPRSPAAVASVLSSLPSPAGGRALAPYACATAGRSGPPRAPSLRSKASTCARGNGRAKW